MLYNDDNFNRVFIFKKYEASISVKSVRRRLISVLLIQPFCLKVVNHPNLTKFYSLNELNQVVDLCPADHKLDTPILNESH